jgi:hypothetical protein
LLLAVSVTGIFFSQFPVITRAAKVARLMLSCRMASREFHGYQREYIVSARSL